MADTKKITIPRIHKMYQNGEKLTMVTAYDYTMAKIVDGAGVDMILVGDSLGMVVQGHANTLPVTIEEMIYHTQCVAKAATHSHLMVDMPFLSYQASHEEAVKNAGLLIKAGAESVKIEGGEEMADLIWYLDKVGIPAMGHIGLKPQSIHRMGGYKVQGQTKFEADEIINDAQVLEESGAFAILLEGLPLEVAQTITQDVEVPTIGIGSGPHCSGQVLVGYDLLGANPFFKPRFVKNYLNLHDLATKALGEFIGEVRSGAFPAEEHSVHRDLTVLSGGDNPESTAISPKSKNLSIHHTSKKTQS